MAIVLCGLAAIVSALSRSWKGSELVREVYVMVTLIVNEPVYSSLAWSLA